jgi:3-hydroxy-9,10-secoandrosta-1,3,5(10)-triene-9,17-dione monooxygenase
MAASRGMSAVEVTTEELVARAAALRERLFEEADAAEERGGYSPEMHEAFAAAGFYRMLQPRMFGGYELSLADYFRVIIEIGRGDPQTGWALCLAAGHAFQIGAFFGEQAQAEVFGGEEDVVIPSRAVPGGTATRVDGGWLVDGTWDYCSGATYSTHALLLAVTPGEPPPGRSMVIVPRADYEILDDWGGGRTLGLGGTGSNSIRVVQAFVPDHLAVPYDWKDYVMPEGGTLGYRLHGNPQYVGRSLTFFYGELNCTQVGAARCALDVYTDAARERKTSFPPPMPRSESPDYQRWLGEASSLTDTAEIALLGAAERYTAACHRWAEHGEPFTVAHDAALRDVCSQAGKLAWNAVDLMFATGGSTAAKRGSRLQRCFRDAMMFRTHIGAQYDVISGSTGRVRLGQPLTH